MCNIDNASIFGVIMRRLYIALVLVFGAAGAVDAKCIIPASQFYVAIFASDPARYYSLFNQQSDALAWSIRQLATAQDVGPKKILASHRFATFNQRAFIGTGLAAAAGACKFSNPEITRSITNLMRNVFDPDIKRAFAKGWQADDTMLQDGDFLTNRVRKPTRDMSEPLTGLPFGSPFRDPSNPFSGPADPFARPANPLTPVE